MTGDEFIKDLLSAMPNPEARMLLITRLAKYSGQTIYFPVESKQGRRIRAAQNMLNNQMGTSEIIRALVERYGISSRQAQRDIQEARNMS